MDQHILKTCNGELEVITTKVLSKELKELELVESITRTDYVTSPVTVKYELTKYSQSLNKIIDEMQDFVAAPKANDE